MKLFGICIAESRCMYSQSRQARIVSHDRTASHKIQP